MYKKGDIIIHNYECRKAVAVVLLDEIHPTCWAQTEFISCLGTTRSRWNTCNKYVFKPNPKRNIPQKNIISTIGFMNIEGKIITGPEGDDWYETEEEDD